ncbi:hypothetical protein B0I35DRAFT_409681 [Stachybotrys elegans]|uniref:Uncharacterized protein n=1 Tax=Stachybotrys elegans TaxID=80388 RepID=A0A8K0WRE2_9HYPO|nr:hypothetical protein B0I35DRAFT_409681 [Stachybotrys elegans]
MARSWSLLVLLISSVLATDMAAELSGSWKMGLRPRQSGTNLQPFTGALGGVTASAITNSGNTDRPFEVDGDTFPDFPTAANRACDNQKNACAELANNGGGNFEVGQCDEQSNQCKAAISTATETTFNVLVSQDADFDYFCDL